VHGGYAARKWVKKHGYPSMVLEAERRLIGRLGIRILIDLYEEDDLYEVMERYRLLPSDRIIAFTCRHYGIDTIITFDDDFKRVPWLRVVP